MNRSPIYLAALSLLSFAPPVHADSDVLSVPLPVFCDAKHTSTAITKNYDEKRKWGEAGTCVALPLKQVWLAYQDQHSTDFGDSGAKLSGVKCVAGSPIGLDAHYVHSFGVSWNIQYIHEIIRGTPQNPQEIRISYQSHNVSSLAAIGFKPWSGVVELTALGPNLTAVVVRDENMNARTPDDTTGTAYGMADTAVQAKASRARAVYPCGPIGQ